MVLQDDMLPSDGFLEAFEGILDAIGQRNVGLSAFCPGGDPGRMALAMARPKAPKCMDLVAIPAKTGTIQQIPDDMIAWGGSLALPSRLVPGMIRWCDAHTGPLGKTMDDQRIWLWASVHRFRMYHTIPAMLDHIGWDRSCIGGAAEEWRRGCGYVDDARNIDWEALCLG
jgi:hypothetical protein